MKKEFECDLSTMIVVERPRTNLNPGMQLRITEKKQLRMNGKLRQDVKKRNPSMKFRFLREEDVKKIALENKPDAADIVKFHADGSLFHADFVRELEIRGYHIPAAFLVEWDEKKNAWIGVLQDEVPNLSDVKGIVKKANVKKNTRNKTNVKK